MALPMATDNFTMWLDLNTSTSPYSSEVMSVTEKSQEMSTLSGTHYNATHLQTNSIQTTVQTAVYNISYNESTSIDIAETVRSRYETTETSMGFGNTSSECWELVNKSVYYYKEGMEGYGTLTLTLIFFITKHLSLCHDALGSARKRSLRHLPPPPCWQEGSSGKEPFSTRKTQTRKIGLEGLVRKESPTPAKVG